ncbi:MULTISPECIES: bifunctional diguanylate cyclase/phosphodiesterase [Pseudomonas]|jgi:PAS domain S-box/diguanylate cyclase (GGDEF) domain|uniref:bifunctional diguanylate cyclase/phosphodiesterase n=1 Tax=Pseudomonas TaxID=286 RepID=UPI00025FE0EE|nr:MULTISPECIES: bifunctional diguanylate cyclase/phosphodiesterase [Pseudomonas]EIK57714.1 diguanylate cyclase (GGDEF) domain protein [Pseudomonas fluorescens Q8r1-96]KIR16576.1 Cyclic di-GMP phosphodiesterase Gmr [Pseudomonas fluorescens]KAB0518584.1 EAL domain-containing protein [Pseudomonas brassicacearum subsp. brassicacearum]NJP64109.1 EAL domain-containing protein [Pseudomonas brassicacearum]PJH90487.1 bifunctional diguanylate cyclase/phosphodiesterase [Pseudomonas sp. WCS365]
MPRLTAALLLSLMTWTATAGALTLTDEELRWLKDHPDLRLGVDASWPPFEFRDDQGRYQGLAADYVEIIRERLAIKLTPIEPASWTAVLEQVVQGKIDLLPGIMSTPERQNYLAFTRPYLDFPIVILAHRGGAQPHNLKELYGLKIAVVENYAPHELLRNHHPDLNLVALPNVSSALQALATDEVDAVVGDLASSVWSLRQLKLEGLYVSGETPYRYQLAMAVPRDNKILVGILDKVMADMSPAEVAEIQQKWVGNVHDYRQLWSDLLLYGLPALLLLVGILAVVIRINRRLSSEIARRVELEQELRSSEYHYRGLVESLSAIAWEARVSDFTYSYVSPHAEDLLGYPLSHWLIPGFWRNIIHPADLIRAQTYCDHEVLAGRDHCIDYRVITADGRCLWVRDIVSLIEHGHEPVMRGLMIDISEAKRTEEALRLSEQKFASVFRQCPDILVIARLLDGCLLEVNKAFEEQVGLSAAEVVGRNATELNIWGIQGVGPALLQRLQAGSIRNLEMPFRRSNGQVFTGLISAEPFDLDTTPALVVVVRDISQLKETQQQLQTSEEKFAKAFHASPDGLLLSRQSDGLLIEVNEGFSRITGFNSALSVDRSTLDLGIWVNLNERKQMLDLLKRDGFVRDFSCHIRRNDGQIRLCEVSSRPLPIGNEDCMLTIARDITERHLMQEKLQQAATVFESTAEGVLITDTQQHISAVNRAFTEITGYSETEALGHTPRLLASGLHDSAFYAAMWHQLTAEGHWQGEISNRRKNGELYPSWLTISAVRNRDRQITHFVAVFADISSLKHAQARLDYQAHHDPLTGLPNRTLFESRLLAALNGQQENGGQGAVLFLDLDRFKHINDSLGHPVGDLLLKGIAVRLREQLRDIDTVARLGGDEFIILLPGLQQPSDAEHIAQKLLNCFGAPFQAGEHEFFISASIGTSLYPQDGCDVATLVKNADAAMYRSKAKGRNRVESYTRDLTAQASERVALEHELRRAIERNELSLSFQPKISLIDNQLVGAEALIRWTHPTFGDVPPEHFIPLAEENGMILQIGDWVLERACRQLCEWNDAYDSLGPLSVNLAGAQLRQPNLLGRIEQLLRENQLEPGLLQLEITENFIMSQAEEALTVLHQLKKLGVQLAIDDFGTGYSSLSYLKRLPLDILKIDQSFVRGLPDDPHDAAIVRAIIALGRSMQFTVIAEGVETLAQQQFLTEEGCEQIQGYIVSLPLCADEFAATFLRMTVSDFSDSTAEKPSL